VIEFPWPSSKCFDYGGPRFRPIEMVSIDWPSSGLSYMRARFIVDHGNDHGYSNQKRRGEDLLSIQKCA